MKRSFVIMLAAVALFAMTACDMDKPVQEPAVSGTTPQQPTQATQEKETVSSDEPKRAETHLIGKWVLSATMPGNVQNTQTLEFKEDGTMVYISIQRSADGTVSEQDPIVYQWTLEDGQVTCVSRNHTIVYLFDVDASTLTDKNQIGRIFTPAE